MGLDSTFAQVQRGRDLSVAQTPRQESENINLPGGQTRCSSNVLRGHGTCMVFDELPCACWRHQGITRGDHAYRCEDLLGGASLRRKPLAPPRIASYT